MFFGVLVIRFWDKNLPFLRLSFCLFASFDGYLKTFLRFVNWVPYSSSFEILQDLICIMLFFNDGQSAFSFVVDSLFFIFKFILV